MGADFSNNSNSNIEREEIKLKELTPNSIFRLKQEFSRNPSGFHLGRKQAMSILNIGQSNDSTFFLRSKK